MIRYADDIHYRGGALLIENFSWASTISGFMAKPPDPLLLPETWREHWLERLQNMPFFAKNWLEHTYKDAYWNMVPLMKITLQLRLQYIVWVVGVMPIQLRFHE